MPAQARPWRPRLAALPLAAAAAVAAVAIVAIPNGDHSRGLPILGTPEASAADLRRHLPEIIGTQTKPASAHAFQTANGTAYVLTTTDHRVCLVVPDSVPESYGSTCSDTRKAEAQGISVSLVTGQRSQKPSSLIALLPAAVTSAKWTPSGGTSTVVRAKLGIVQIRARTGGQLTWTSTSGEEHARLPRPIPEIRRAFVTCSNGTEHHWQRGEPWPCNEPATDRP